MSRVWIVLVCTMVLATFAGAAQLVATTKEVRACGGLECWAQSDCGSHCMCSLGFDLCLPPAP